MARPQYLSLDQGLENWDAIINANFLTVLRDSPVPVRQYSSFASLPPAGDNERCIAVAFDDVVGGTNKWLVVYSDGTAWKKIGQQAAFQANSNALTVAELVADFNALLGKLRSSGLMTGA